MGRGERAGGREEVNQEGHRMGRIRRSRSVAMADGNISFYRSLVLVCARMRARAGKGMLGLRARIFVSLTWDNMTGDRSQLAPTIAFSSFAASSSDSAIPAIPAFSALPAPPYSATAAAARPGSITAGGGAEWAWEAAAGPGPADPFRGDWPHWGEGGGLAGSRPPRVSSGQTATAGRPAPAGDRG